MGTLGVLRAIGLALVLWPLLWDVAHADAPVAAELRLSVDQLVESVRSRSADRVDDLVCIELLALAQAERRVRLGLLEGGEKVEFIEKFRSEYRRRVYKWVDDLLERGGEVVGVEVSRVMTSGPEDEERESWIQGDGTASQEITAAGIIGVTQSEDDRVADIPVTRVEERWCLHPVAPE